MPHKVCRFAVVLPQGSDSDEARLDLSIELPAGPGVQEKLLPVFNSICRAALATLGHAVEGPFCVERSEAIGLTEQLVLDSPNEFTGFEVPQ